MGLRIDEIDRYTPAEIAEMVEAHDEEEQKNVRRIAKALWWTIAPHLDKKARESLQVEDIARSLPGFAKLESEE